MADVTRRELIDEAALRVGELAVGQTLSADQLVQYQNNATYLFDQLSEDNILTLADEEAIPASYVPYLATLLGNLAGVAVGIPFSLEVKKQTEAVLRKLLRGGATYEQQTPDYF